MSDAGCWEGKEHAKHGWEEMVSSGNRTATHLKNGLEQQEGCCLLSAPPMGQWISGSVGHPLKGQEAVGISGKPPSISGPCVVDGFHKDV